MASSKAEITALAQVIAHSLGDSNTLAVAYVEVMDALARRIDPPLVESTTFAITALGGPRYTHPSTGVRVLAVFNENSQLNQVTKAELEGYNKAWRKSLDTPEAYFVDEETVRSIRLYPAPTANATGTWLVSAGPAEAPDYMVLYITFAMLEREFAYPSAHQDKAYSKLCGEIAQIFGMLVGVV